MTTRSFAPFPLTRPRRLRQSAWSRAMTSENAVTPSDLIWPLFIREGDGVEEPVASMPGVSRLSAAPQLDEGLRCAVQVQLATFLPIKDGAEW